LSEQPWQKNNHQSENRLWQDFTTRISDNFALRLRLEERKWDNNGTIGLRARQRLTLTYPIATDAPANALSAWTESFFVLNETKNSPNRGLDQWRNFIGFQFGEDLRWELGYMNQAFLRPNNKNMNHVLMISARLTL
jgi:hypothetical protein